ncbi:Lrp/AsnC ligand binding domain-containing protein [Mesorhizobium sp. M1252]|uniref:Lrp/AsnC ligand binding domain-containing protein n=1 Tax=Mesorhizobium sp. M1252 TaxID=2957073 RepID=UPI00333C2A93
MIAPRFLTAGALQARWSIMSPSRVAQTPGYLTYTEAAIQEIPEILDCWGRIDYLMRVSSPSTAAYRDFMECIDQYYSLVVTKPLKSNSSIPLGRIKIR